MQFKHTNIKFLWFQILAAAQNFSALQRDSVEPPIVRTYIYTLLQDCRLDPYQDKQLRHTNIKFLWFQILAAAQIFGATQARKREAAYYARLRLHAIPSTSHTI